MIIGSSWVHELTRLVLTPATTGPVSDTALDTLRIFGAGVLLLGLALLATSKRFYWFQRFKPIAPFLSGGWIALATGFLLGPFGVGVIEDESIRSISPLLFIGLGWIGLLIGLQAQRRVLTAIPRTVWNWVLIDVLVTTLLAVPLLYLICDRAQLQNTFPWVVPPVIFLVSATLGWAAETRSLVAEHSPQRLHLSNLVAFGSGLSSIAAIIIFGLGSKFFHANAQGQMQFVPLYGIFRLGASIILAVGAGLVGRYLLSQTHRSKPDSLVVFLAIVGITAGIAVELGSSPLFSAMLVGALVANLAGQRLREFERFIFGGEHVIGVLFALLAGALLDPRIDWWGWAIVAGLVALRQITKPAIMRLAMRKHKPELPMDSPLFMAPIRQSILAIALGVAFILTEVSPYRRRLLTTIVLIGLVCEILPLINSITARWRVIPRIGRRNESPDATSAKAPEASA